MCFSDAAVPAEKQASKESLPTVEGKQPSLRKLKAAVKLKNKEEVKIDLKANLGGISVIVASVNGDFAEIFVGGNKRTLCFFLTIDEQQACSSTNK
mgnify:CR=1 FL=1